MAYRYLLILLLGALALGATTATPAQDARSAQEQREEDDEAQAEQTETGADKPADSKDVFIPTEEISEDFAVSFPVDI